MRLKNPLTNPPKYVIINLSKTSTGKETKDD